MDAFQTDWRLKDRPWNHEHCTFNFAGIGSYPEFLYYYCNLKGTEIWIYPACCKKYQTEYQWQQDEPE